MSKNSTDFEQQHSAEITAFVEKMTEEYYHQLSELHSVFEDRTKSEDAANRLLITILSVNLGYILSQCDDVQAEIYHNVAKDIISNFLHKPMDYDIANMSNEVGHA